MITGCNMRIIVLFIVCMFAFGSIQPQNSERNFEISNNLPVYYDKMKELLTYPMSWQSQKDKNFDIWRKQAREMLFDCMDITQPAPENYDMKIIDSEQRKGYKALKIEFNISKWSRVLAYLLIPNGEGIFPSIVMLHDHGAHFLIGKEKMVRPFNVDEEIMSDADSWVLKCYDGRYVGDYFAMNGYVVLSVDALFWGDRGCREGIDYDRQQALASNFMQMGASWGAYINMDDMRSVDFLASLPFVDKERIGCLGFSMGAYRSWMLSSMTDMVKVSASVCWMNTTDYLMTVDNNQNKGGSAYSMLLPRIRKYFDYPHVASIACPKPSLFFNGSQDKLFPVQGVSDAYSQMKEVWNSVGASGKLVTKMWNEKHFFNKEMQDEVLYFFNKWLKPE